MRVQERLHASARETVYRVVDPRRQSDNGLALLRHLSENEMADAVRPDEYRQRFAALTGVQHTNLAATYEVLDISDRPAVLQEYVSGLPSNEWPALAATPGVWLKLLTQVALGLKAGHDADITHGRLRGESIVLTAAGTVKVCGLGEPSWLASGDEPTDDLAALGKLALGWAMLTPRRKNAKPKPLHDAMQSLLIRLSAVAGDGTRITSVNELLAAIEEVRASVPESADVWARLLAQVEPGQDSPPTLRQAS